MCARERVTAKRQVAEDLAVPIGQGIGGRVLALGRPVRVNDYVGSPSVTHQLGTDAIQR